MVNSVELIKEFSVSSSFLIPLHFFCLFSYLSSSAAPLFYSICFSDYTLWPEGISAYLPFIYRQAVKLLQIYYSRNYRIYTESYF